jgi:hypothetical protein
VYAIATVLLACVLIVACRNDGGSTSGTETMSPAASSATKRYVGCVGPTVAPDVFVLAVSQGRDFSTGEPPGAPIPQKGELPGGVSAPIPPIPATSGTPGGGPTPTTTIATYTLAGDGGTDLQEHVGHTVEVVGHPTREPEGQISGRLSVTSVRPLAEFCK